MGCHRSAALGYHFSLLCCIESDLVPGQSEQISALDKLLAFGLAGSNAVEGPGWQPELVLKFLPRNSAAQRKPP